MLKKKDNKKLNYLIDIQEYLEGYRVVNIQISRNRKILVLCINEVPERIDGMFVQAKTVKVYNYRVIEINSYNNSDIYCLDLLEQKFYYHFIQSIDESNYLLVGGRCRYYSEDKQDYNAKIIDENSNLIREFVLGDGIQDVLVSNNNDIWTSYYDEGIFGNYGWSNPIGSCGLISWDINGNQKFRFEGDDDHFICDCYALNISDNNDIWFYYYTEFELGRIDGNGSITYYKPNISGADGLLVSNKYILFRGGYSNHNEYQLYKRTITNSLKLIDKFKLYADDKEVNESIFSCRGSYMVHLINNKIYDFSLE
ncbi:hypothetical protein [Vallitalea okinawensis]|uniref:hypothetical protein n=1 Tax=Vallitalea okinawensis TaxID=2078660 RepID=UPI000CFCD114|nr:hypothetical protein [Vallitalea okinawensis]